jgi:hypothetical protein
MVRGYRVLDYADLVGGGLLQSNCNAAIDTGMKDGA